MIPSAWWRLRMRYLMHRVPWLSLGQRNHLSHNLRNRLCTVAGTARAVADFASEGNRLATDCAVDVLRREIDELERCMGRLGI